MNKQRRKAIQVEQAYLAEKIEVLQAAIDAGQLVPEGFTIDVCGIESVRDDEQEAYDNLPESLQSGERGEQMQESIQYLEDAISGVEEATGLIENSGPSNGDDTAQDTYVTVIEVLESAVEALDNAAA